MEETREMIEVSRPQSRARDFSFRQRQSRESQQKALQAVEDTAKKVLPPAYHVRIGGSSQTFTGKFQ